MEVCMRVHTHAQTRARTHTQHRLHYTQTMLEAVADFGSLKTGRKVASHPTNPYQPLLSLLSLLLTSNTTQGGVAPGASDQHRPAQPRLYRGTCLCRDFYLSKNK